MKDLFEDIKSLPAPVQAIIGAFDDNNCSYAECSKMEAALMPLGYTFEWGLDGTPYDLQKITRP